MEKQTLLQKNETFKGSLFFGSRQLKVAEMDGRAGAKKKRETVRKRSAGAVADQNWSKIARSKKTQFSPPSKRTGGLTGTKKKAFPYSLISLQVAG